MSECEACERADATVEAEFKGREILWNGQEPWQRTIGEMVKEHHAEIERLRAELKVLGSESSTERRER